MTYAKAHQPRFDRATAAPQSGAPALIERVRSRYQLLEIRRHPQYGAQLYIDGDLQISESDVVYGAAIAAPAAAAPALRRVAILGGGDGGALNEVLRTADAAGAPLETVTLVDIDAEAIALARRHLPGVCGRAFDDPRAQVIVRDALAYVRSARGLDAVICDLTMEPVRAGQSRSAFMEEIVAHAAAALRPGGIFSVQAGGTAEHADIIRELRAVVAARFEQLQEQNVFVPSYEGLWTFIAARKPAGEATR
ncbi:MAG TPA: methyltransferase [Burkholderiales bacterium]